MKKTFYKKGNKWCLIKIKIPDSYHDLIIGQLYQIGFTGFLQTANELHCYLNNKDWTSKTNNSLKVILTRFTNEFPFLNPSFTKEHIIGQNWNKKWEEQVGIIEVTQNIVIKPTWKQIPKKFYKKIVINIDPKMSFGTGHHETTGLCLRMIERWLRPQVNVLDFGCGTGILGIACMKLGAKSVLAIDNDYWAITNTIENMKKNNISKYMKVQLSKTNNISKKKFELIISNIDFTTILKSLRFLSSKLIKGGLIILSGFLTNDIDKLLPLFKKHSLVPIEIDSENNWISIALCKM